MRLPENSLVVNLHVELFISMFMVFAKYFVQAVKIQ